MADSRFDALNAALAEARKRLGWSLRTAGRVSGVPNAHISQIETGAIANPGFRVVVKLVTAYGMDLAALAPTMGAAAPPEVFIEGADEDLYEVTLTLCEQCLNGEGGECHHPGCALWLNRAPDISLQGNPMVCFRPAPTV